MWGANQLLGATMAATVVAHSASFAFQSLDPPRSSYHTPSSSLFLASSRRRPNSGFDATPGDDDDSMPRKNYSIDDNKS